MPQESVTLGELLNRVGQALKKEVSGHHWFISEILELRENRNGHCYLELVDKAPDGDAILARARATIWASRYQMLRPFFEASTGTSLKSGIRVLCKASVEFHPVYGFSLNITDIDPAYTLGDLARKKQEVVLRLNREGVMDMNRELPFPMVPQRVAVISSETAAGYGDFMDSLQKNPQGFLFRISLFSAVMQGDDAPRSIMEALDLIHSREGAFDCVAVVRGGGSRADLECFNDYELAYYVTQFPLPVLTGIGHERDESVVDMVAARGLKTPTAVAGYLVDRMLAFEMSLAAFRDRLTAVVSGTVHEQKLQMERMAANLLHLSRASLRGEKHRLRQAELAVRKDSMVLVGNEHGRLQQSAGALRKGSAALVKTGREQLVRYQQNLRKDLSLLLTRQKEQLRVLDTKRTLVDPSNILKRGFSMTLSKGSILTDAASIRRGDVLETRLYKGSIISTTEKTKNKDA